MKTIETTATITEDGQLILQVSTDLLPGQHRVVVVIDEQPELPKSQIQADPLISTGQFPVALRRKMQG